MIYTEEMKWFINQIDPVSINDLKDIINYINIPESKENEIYSFYITFLKDLLSLFENATDDILLEINEKTNEECLFFYKPDIENFNEYRKEYDNDAS